MPHDPHLLHTLQPIPLSDIPFLLSLHHYNSREYATAKKKKFKPVVISHHMLAGLKEGQEKMSKSDPDSAIFMEGERGRRAGCSVLLECWYM